jgi:carbon storage regulator
MLILSRKKGQKIVIGDVIVLTILSVKGREVSVGIDAPRSIAIYRDEAIKKGADSNPSSDND